jgi:transposase
MTNRYIFDARISERKFKELLKLFCGDVGQPIIKGQALSQTTVYTDSWLGYDGLLLSGYKHRRVYHRENDFARGKNPVNGIECFWSYAMFRFIKLRGFRPEFFFLHLKKSEWRWNYRFDNLFFLLIKNLRLKRVALTWT